MTNPFPPGFCAMTTHGTLQQEMVGATLEMRGLCEREGIQAKWEMVHSPFVEPARNSAVKQMLTTPAQWLLFIDGDCIFPPTALRDLLQFAYRDLPAVDMVGAYNPLRGFPHLPTIDTGTGTWESQLPYGGPVQVMRTGSAFVLIKRHVYEHMTDPWYGLRNPMRPIDAMTEVDNWALQRFDGKNPLKEHPAWATLFQCAVDDPASRKRPDPGAFVGEDSAFCDRARLLGFQVWVHTDIECQHVDRRVITAGDHRTAIQGMENRHKAFCGVRG